MTDKFLEYWFEGFESSIKDLIERNALRNAGNLVQIHIPNRFIPMNIKILKV